MLYAINCYNNCINPRTIMTAFETINEHTSSKPNILQSKPSQIMSKIVLENYEISQELYKDLTVKWQEFKEKVINKANENRQKPLNYSNQHFVYLPTKERNKVAPKFKTLHISNKQDDPTKIRTTQGIYCKNKLKRPKINNKYMLQNFKDKDKEPIWSSPPPHVQQNNKFPRNHRTRTPIPTPKHRSRKTSLFISNLLTLLWID